MTNQTQGGYSRRLTSTEKAVLRLGLEGQAYTPRTETEAAAYQLGQQQRAAKTSQPAQEQVPQKTTGPVGKAFNIGIDAAYASICGLFAVLSIAVLAVSFSWWAVLCLIVFGYFTYRNVRNIVVHRGRD
jgi:uncharacterized membrane protein